MVMRTAVFAALVAADVGLTPEEIAINYNIDSSAVETRLNQLADDGHVWEQNGVYFPSEQSEPAVVSRYQDAASH